MGSSNIIVKEYLESLKEDKELDYLFPILLSLMGFRVVATAAESKGRSQYGKDIVAVGADEYGVKKRFYFELKGYSAKDINQSNLFGKDGILESIREAKYTAFSDQSIPGFNDLPIQIVVVHNGVLASDSRPSFEGLITKEFPDGGFERWDIYRLTDLFAKHLFGEYLFTDEETIRLFKRTLVLLDAPDYEFSDFHKLVELQTAKTYQVGSRALKKFFSSMNLMAMVIVHYSKENNNVYPARECITYLVLKVWNWILKEKLENKNAVLREFRKLITIHFELLTVYFRKTLPAVTEKNGLFSSAGGKFESIGYPLRCFDFLGYFTYYMHARLHYREFAGQLKGDWVNYLVHRLHFWLTTLLNNNEACRRPLIDNHSIPIMQVVLFFLRNREFIPNYRENAKTYLSDVFNSLVTIQVTRERLPEVYNNVGLLTEFVATGKRPHFYTDSSSLLITYLFELVAVIDDKEIYDTFRGHFSGKVDLQMAYCALPTGEYETAMFEKNLYREMHVKTGIRLPEDFEQFKRQVYAEQITKRSYRTDEAGFPFLRDLAGIYFKNEFLPDEWRRYMDAPAVAVKTDTAADMS